jgi:hypothetical protein
MLLILCSLDSVPGISYSVFTIAFKFIVCIWTKRDRGPVEATGTTPPLPRQRLFWLVPDEGRKDQETNKTKHPYGQLTHGESKKSVPGHSKPDQQPSINE